MTDMPTIERVREPKVYCGNRGRFNTLVEVRQRGVARPLELRLDLFNHSPLGFDWGYAGSGPAQLALAILADHVDDHEKAVRLHQTFDWSVVANSIATGSGSRPDDTDRWPERHRRPSAHTRRRKRLTAAAAGGHVTKGNNSHEESGCRAASCGGRAMTAPNGHPRGDSHNISPLSNGNELPVGRVVSLPAPFWARRMSRAAGLLRGRALNVYLSIASHSWSPGKPAWPSLATISEKTGIDRRHLPALIHQIEDAGLLRVRRRRGRGTVFEPVDDAELSPPEVTPLSPPEVTPLSPPEVTEQGRGTREKERAPPGGGAARERAIPATHSTGALNGSSQGHHLPADWTPTAADVERARSRGLDPDEEAEAFRDHWHAETGPKTLKRDWDAAYRTWCRHSVGRRASDRGGARLTAAEERRRRGTEAIYRAAVARR